MKIQKRQAEKKKQFPEQALKRVLEKDCFKEIFHDQGRQVLLNGLVWWMEHPKNHQIVSITSLNRDDRGRPTLWNVCTSTKFQKQGHAERLLRAVLEIWKTHPQRQPTEHLLYLYVKKTALGALHLYEKLGFHILHSSSTPTEWHMSLEL